MKRAKAHRNDRAWLSCPAKIGVSCFAVATVATRKNDIHDEVITYLNSVIRCGSVLDDPSAELVTKYFWGSNFFAVAPGLRSVPQTQQESISSSTSPVSRVRSDHPNIKPGDLCVAHLNGLVVNGEPADVLCIVKCENTAPFLQILMADGALCLRTHHGIYYLVGTEEFERSRFEREAL